MGYTHKRLAFVPDQRNTPELVAERALYCEGMQQIYNDRILCFDESGFTTHTLPLKGWAPRGQPAYFKKPGNRTRNVSLLLVSSIYGPVAWQLCDQNVDATTIAIFFQFKVLLKLWEPIWVQRLESCQLNIEEHRDPQFQRGSFK